MPSEEFNLILRHMASALPVFLSKHTPKGSLPVLVTFSGIINGMRKVSETALVFPLGLKDADQRFKALGYSFPDNWGEVEAAFLFLEGLEAVPETEEALNHGQLPSFEALKATQRCVLLIGRTPAGLVNGMQFYLDEKMGIKDDGVLFLSGEYEQPDDLAPFLKHFFEGYKRKLTDRMWEAAKKSIPDAISADWDPDKKET